jgi:PTH1 family peptidyl-tRNA hydrolase
MFNKPVFLVTGLGNPGDEYRQTFHNAGFLCVDEAAKKLGISFTKGECRAITAHYKTPDAKVILAKPITYMNLSGFAVQELVRKYKVEQSKFLVVYDDIDLPLGAIRIKQQGSAGTHNGMKDIVNKMGTTDIMRVRIGIGKEWKGDLADFVLSRISAEDMEVLSSAISKAADAIIDFIKGGDISAIMRKYNG